MAKALFSDYNLCDGDEETMHCQSTIHIQHEQSRTAAPVSVMLSKHSDGITASIARAKTADTVLQRITNNESIEIPHNIDKKAAR
jgi:hypothetical protein